MKILIMSDSPHIPTGLGRVGRELALGLAKRGHQIGYIAWFHHEEIPQLPIPGIQIWFTNDNQYGAQVLDKVVNRFQPDIVLTIGDMWTLWYFINSPQCQTRRYFQWCAYIPVDGEPLNGGLPPGLIHIVEDVDIPVAYTDYAKNAVLKSINDQETRNKITTIYHGVNTSIYHPITQEEKLALRRQMGIPEDKFIFLTISRNQSRKNIPDLLRAWKIFSEQPGVKDKVLLWPHMYFNDPQGWNIDHLFEIIGLKNQSIMYYNQIAHTSHEMLLLSEPELAKLYQIADAFVLLAGEGFGLPTLEAMASRLPCILLDYAASSELGAEGRAELVSVPIDDTVTWTGVHLTQRPAPNPKRVVESFNKIFQNKMYRDGMAEKAYAYATQFTWDKILDEWEMLFIEHEIPFLKPQTFEVVC